MSIKEFTEQMNALAAGGVPFLFVVDFEMQRPLLFSLAEIDPRRVLYHINGAANYRVGSTWQQPVHLKKFPITFDKYRLKFDAVRAHLGYGDSYLTNLTVKTRVESPLTLREMFFAAKAKYKLWIENRFLVFSPETFVRIAGGKIFAHPMKGTIDASLPNARESILADKKELAEHVTIVDLIRNDLSAVAHNVMVTRFRYVDEVRTTEKHLLQVSSEISGELSPGYQHRLGDIILSLIPAGSVSGAPKCKTLAIIREAEVEPRGYYTGVVGLFDGTMLDSGVMIRFIEHDGEALFYRSGGGITVQSVAQNEYQEAIDKVYVPID